MTRSMIVGLGVVAVVAQAASVLAAGRQTASPPAQTAAAQTPAAPAADAQPTLAPGTKSVIIQRVLVKVNGEAFTQTDLERLQTDALAKSNQQAGLRNGATDAVIQRQLLQITPGIIVSAIDDMLMIQRARELGYKMSDDQYAKFIESIKADNHITTEDQYKKALTDQGLTEEQLRKNLEHEYLIQAVQQSEIMGRTPLTEEEARQYYKAHPDEFLTPAKVTLSEILVVVPTVPTASTSGQPSFNAGADEAARDKANAIRDRLLKGEDFATVAKEVSDSPSKATGGLIGDVNLADMSEVLRPIVDALKPGEVTTPLRNARGYQILKLDSRSPEQPKPFEDVREAIGDKIYQARLGGEQAKYLQKIRAQALIEWKDENLKDMYLKQLGEMNKAGGTE